MRRVEHAFYLLPNRNPRGQPYVSKFRMTAEDAKARGAIKKVEHGIETREVPETDAERLQATMHYQSAGHDSVKPPPKESP